VIVPKSALFPNTTCISDADRLRDRARRLLELATRSHCEGRSDYAALLMQAVNEILEHAVEIEERQESEGINPSLGKSNGTSGRQIA
jgi:hypothetical protein